MNCPVCTNQDTKVIDSRVMTDGHSIRRRRSCSDCEFRFSTSEEVEILDVMLVKRDGRRELYRREKLEGGLRKAFEKRPLTDEQFRAIVTSIECGLQRIRKNEIPSDVLGEIVMDQLKESDTVAYIRFASVYRSFEDIESFQDELTKLSRPKTKSKKEKQST